VLRLSRFTYLAPGSLEEAMRVRSENGSETVFMAGGTDLLVNIKQRVTTPRFVIGIRNLPELQGISTDSSGWLTIGAAVTINRLEHDPRVSAAYPALSHAAGLISVPQVRALGTIGGNVCLDVRCNYYNQSYEWRKGIGFCTKRGSEICRVAPGSDRCWAVASADTVPVLIALRAECTIVGPTGTRRVAIEDLYQDDGLIPTTLQPDEIVSAIQIPPPDGYRCVYQKFRIRHSFDFPLVGVSAAVKISGRDIVDTRIVLTAVASRPERASSAEAALNGAGLDETAISRAGQAVFRQAKPMDNTAGSIFHRKRMARVLLERALKEIAGHTAPIRDTA
jgi:4-hydroxybenzoyl-CoA reductase subunit beta